MKKLKFITAFVLTVLMTFTSCQSEVDVENGENPNTNSSNSPTANHLVRTSMYDGSFDDFLDNVSCSSILLPVTAIVNGTEVNIVSEADYQLVLNILGQLNTDNDTVELQFPFTVKLGNYTEVEVTNQAEYDEIIAACETAEQNGEDAISCINIDFPVSVLTYNLNLDQTGSVVLNSEQELYNYMTNFDSNQLFAINYPITATLANGTDVTLSSDVDLQQSISDCLEEEDQMEEAEEQADELEEVLVNGLFQIESFVNSGVDTASDYAEFTIDFANDLTVVADNTVDATVQDVQGTYEVTSQMDVYLELNFSGNTSFSLLNQNWEVTSYSSSTIELQSTINSGITLVLTQI